MVEACTQDSTASGFCLNCDNRHGCKTEEPLCLKIEPRAAERFFSGKRLMVSRGVLCRCRRCGHFRQCWSTEKYRRALLTF